VSLDRANARLKEVEATARDALGQRHHLTGSVLDQEGARALPGETYHDHDTERGEHGEASRVEDVLGPDDCGEDKPGKRDGREVERPRPRYQGRHLRSQQQDQYGRTGHGIEAPAVGPSRTSPRNSYQVSNPWLPALSQSSYHRSGSHFIAPTSDPFVTCLLYKYTIGYMNAPLASSAVTGFGALLRARATGSSGLHTC
jgi:hypothetical protein